MAFPTAVSPNVFSDAFVAVDAPSSTHFRIVFRLCLNILDDCRTSVRINDAMATKPAAVTIKFYHAIGFRSFRARVRR